MRVSFHSWVAEDLAGAMLFYEEQEAGLGDKFLESIMADALSLARTAGIHRRMLGYYRKLGSVFPFGIYYAVESHEEARIFAILDQRREPTWIRSELGERN